MLHPIYDTFNSGTVSGLHFFGTAALSIHPVPYYEILNTSHSTDGISYVIGPLTPGVPQEIHVFANKATIGYRASITQASTGSTILAIASIPLGFSTTGPFDVRLNITPVDNYVKVSILAITSTSGLVELFGTSRDSITFTPQTSVAYISNDDQYHYGFNGQMKDNEIAGVGNSLDFGNRMFDTRVARFRSLDKYMSKFPWQSPYLFAANSPIGAKDVNGDYVYILAYTAGNKHGGDRMFRAAALTRAYDITHSKGFDAKRDVVAVIAVTDLGKVAQQVQNATATLSPQYGKTKEFGLWSHSASRDGAIGSALTSTDDAAGAPNQMSMAGWGKINFNWSQDGNVAGFYGCNGGNPNNTNGVSFGTRLSGLSNFSGVSVLAQPSSSFPSQYTDERNEALYQATGDYLPVESIQGRSEMIILQKTYMVSGTKGEGWQAFLWSTPAAPMQVSVNGQVVGSQPQPGTSANPPVTPPPAPGQ